MAVVANDAATEPAERLSWRDGCPCGPTELPMLLVCAQPRILPQAASLSDLPDAGKSLRSEPAVPCGGRPEPLVPPPRISPV